MPNNSSAITFHKLSLSFNIAKATDTQYTTDLQNPRVITVVFERISRCSTKRFEHLQIENQEREHII